MEISCISMSECHIDNHLHLATGWVDVECNVMMLQAHFALSRGTGHTSAIMKTVAKVFYTQLPEYKIFATRYSPWFTVTGGMIPVLAVMLGFRDVGFESF